MLSRVTNHRSGNTRNTTTASIIWSKCKVGYKTLLRIVSPRVLSEYERHLISRLSCQLIIVTYHQSPIWEHDISKSFNKKSYLSTKYVGQKYKFTLRKILQALMYFKITSHILPLKMLFPDHQLIESHMYGIWLYLWYGVIQQFIKDNTKQARINVVLAGPEDVDTQMSLISCRPIRVLG